MTSTPGPWRLFSLCLAVLLCTSIAQSHKRRTHSSSTKRSTRHQQADKSEESDGQKSSSNSENSSADKKQVWLNLSDGTRVAVEDAWESEQGVWYRQSGVSHVVPRDRIKSIERGSNAKPRIEPQVARVTLANPAEASSTDQPVWIYMIGGARVEADSAIESNAGVWYRRGSLSVFVERARIEHLEREELGKVAESDSSSKKERGWSTGSPKTDSLIRQSGARYVVDPYLIFCVMEQESHFNSRAVSPKGARGLMQLMPGTGRRFGVRHPFSASENVAGGTRYLKQLLEQFNGRVDLVLASYNAGEGAVLKFGRRVPPYRETRNYVKRIGYRYRRSKPASPASTASTASVERSER